MVSSDFSLTVLGSRGSMAYGGEQCARYGGDSSCYMVRAGEETVFLDAGTGICAELIRYSAGGVDRQLSFSTLSNGMKLACVAPTGEISAPWIRLIRICPSSC